MKIIIRKDGKLSNDKPHISADNRADNSVAAQGRNIVAAQGRNIVAAQGRNSIAGQGRNSVAAQERNSVAGRGRNVKNTLKAIKFSVQKYRFYAQAAFAALCLWIGVEMHLFVNWLESGGSTVFYNRPPGVDGFLPISSLMSVYLFLKTGLIHTAHPAGIFIFIAIVAVSLAFGKSFCSWLCPAGFLSEMLGDLGEKVFGRKIKMPKFLDIPLRSLKYLLLGFFIYSIFFVMTDMAVKTFLDSPYNAVADVKMYHFFANISRFSILVLASLTALSILFRGFWCRYLCPYGAFLGLVSFLSPNKIKRVESTCIDCEACTKVCPSFIKVHKIKTVISDECTSCMACVDACPVKNTLMMGNIVVKKTVSRKFIAVTVVLLFMLVTGLGIITGHWQTSITKEEYLMHRENIDSYGHPTDTKAMEELNNRPNK